MKPFVEVPGRPSGSKIPDLRFSDSKCQLGFPFAFLAFLAVQTIANLPTAVGLPTAIGLPTAVGLTES